MCGDDLVWRLVCCYRQLCQAAQIVDLLRQLHDGQIGEEAQACLLTRCIHDPVARLFPAADAYVL